MASISVDGRRHSMCRCRDLLKLGFQCLSIGRTGRAADCQLLLETLNFLVCCPEVPDLLACCFRQLICGVLDTINRDLALGLVSFGCVSHGFLASFVHKVEHQLQQGVCVLPVRSKPHLSQTAEQCRPCVLSLLEVDHIIVGQVEAWLRRH